MKKRYVAGLLAFFLGFIGIHRFYLGQNKLGLLYLLFFWTYIPFLISIIDFFAFLLMSDAKFSSKYNKGVDLAQAISISSESTAPSTTTMTISLDEDKLLAYAKQSQKDWQQKVKNYQYSSLNIQGRGRQFLESLEIISETKNLDTLMSRHRFADEINEELQVAASKGKYLMDVQKALDDYKAMYYDKIPKSEHVGLLFTPNNGNFEEFYAKCAYNCYLRNDRIQLAQIEQLKRKDAILKRLNHLVEIADQVEELILDAANSEETIKLSEDISVRKDSYYEMINKLEFEPKN